MGGRQEIPIPRTSLSIATAIFSAFPETRNPDNLKKIGNLSPLMIALNEAADIGISAKKRVEKGGIEQWRAQALLLLSGALRENLENRITEFINKHPNEKKLIGAFTKDFLTLSKKRDEISTENWPTFLELDSGIFVAAYIGIVNPEILKQAGVQIYEEANDIKTLRKKYSIFIVTQEERKDSMSPIQQRLRSVFASVMILKTTDDKNDKNGTNVDGLLNLPNFWDYATSINPENPNLEISKIRKIYHQEAKLLFPEIQQISADTLCNLTSIIKAERSKNRQIPQGDPANFWGFFQRIKQTTTLRHELQAAQILTELFR